VAAKNLREAILFGLMNEDLFLSARQTEVLENELRDYVAHRAMLLGESAMAIDLFNDIFKNIPALRPNK
jgi:hypothetical protein